VLITGCGPIGLLAIAVAKSFGAAQVIATEVNAVRSNLAHRMGVDLLLNPMTEGAGIAQRIRDATEGRGVDVSLEMSGHPSALPLVFDALAPGGRVSLLGLFDGPVSLNIDDAIIFRAARVHGIFGRRMFETWYTVQRLLRQPSFREKMGQIITHRVPIRELPRAMDLIRSGEAAKVSLVAQW
jgi:threonine 3-dehydrogenase